LKPGEDGGRPALLERAFVFSAVGELCGRKKVLIDFDFAERSLADIVAALRRGERVKLPLAERAQRAAVEAEPPMTHKEAGALGGKGNKATDKTENISSFGTSASYRAAKLKRHFPDDIERPLRERCAVTLHHAQNTICFDEWSTRCFIRSTWPATNFII
jgi:hypothetical protein